MSNRKNPSRSTNTGNTHKTDFIVNSKGEATVFTHEGIPHLKLVSDNPHIQTKSFTQNVGNIESQTVHNINNHYKNKGKSKPEIPRLLPEQGGLTDGHRATLDKLRHKYVLLLGVIKPNTKSGGLYKIVNDSVCKSAISSGKDGTSSIVRILDVDFERIEKMLKGKIAGLYKNPLVQKCRGELLGYAHKQLKKLGVSEEIRRNYQFEKYGYESMADFSADDLLHYCQYLEKPSPSFDPHENNKALKPKRTAPPSNECKHSGLLIIPLRIDSLFPVIDDMTRAFFSENSSGLPNEVQAWCRLCENPPAGYGVSVGKDRGKDDSLIMQGTKPLSRSAFKRRWKSYTTNKSE